MHTLTLSEYFLTRFGTTTPRWNYRADSPVLNLTCGATDSVCLAVPLTKEDSASIEKMSGSASHFELTLNLESRPSRLYLVGKQVAQGEWAGLIADFVDAPSVFEELEAGISFAEQVISEASSLIVIIDINGNIKRFNQECERLSGMKEQLVIGRDALSMFFKPEEAVVIRQNLKVFFQSMESWETIRDLKTINGIRKVQWRNKLVKNGTVDQWFLVCSGTDITEELEAKEKLKFLATTDTLTGLPNRHSVQESIETKIEEETPFALVFMDLDNFKKVNDHYGHLKGDQLICEVAKAIKECLRTEDTLARLGGDEFLIVLNTSDPTEIASVCTRITIRLKQPFMLDSIMVYTGASMGVSLFPLHGNTLDSLVRSADTAMYVAKENGKGHWEVFSPEMNAKISEFVWLDTQLRGAVDHKELSLAYQPKIHIPSNKVTGFEALLRWNCEGKQIPPDLFIPHAEDSGVILQIGRWVWREALSDIKDLPANTRVAVNLSVKQVMDPTFLDMYKEDLHQAGYLVSPLDFEITESCIVEDSFIVKGVIDALKELGCEVHMDDFGTGFSSLSNLVKTPFDVIKLDRSFMHKIPEDRKATELVRAMVAVAKELNLKVVAEGIETVEQASFLRTIGVQEAQGYLYSKPQSKPDLLAWLSTRNKLKVAVLQNDFFG